MNVNSSHCFGRGCFRRRTSHASQNCTQRCMAAKRLKACGLLIIISSYVLVPYSPVHRALDSRAVAGSGHGSSFTCRVTLLLQAAVKPFTGRTASKIVASARQSAFSGAALNNGAPKRMARAQRAQSRRSAVTTKAAVSTLIPR